ncbi:hypothetical protein NPIL_344111 [Nephila pilipes]|uniref:Uncharacterized protein n=1 Tax=Nephila pilipes TaxID=299642 RepID=A0A8X6NJY1_NEPPI|nr:hypothetical protein NPIL_320241 [Nephila pilipes]GFS34085.1 hypothetical protein NPIL_330581 [Nephila pilipes]GFS52038.1 hypothetical protein NPIL_250771 [Nephila pilipes]GFS67822.1 hypothetical protein NPIL_66071 [Nephila pilipes]GFT19248.1 hypothetical protein NPIL_131501 [Nephila pilipes]
MIIEQTPDPKCIQITKLSEDYDRNQKDVAKMNVYIERNSLELENPPSLDRINAQKLLDTRQELTGKILELFPYPKCNNNIFSNVNFRSFAKVLGFKVPSLPKKKKVKFVTENFAFPSLLSKAKTVKVAEQPKYQRLKI